VMGSCAAGEGDRADDCPVHRVCRDRELNVMS
jgi:hypothetical protein